MANVGGHLTRQEKKRIKAERKVLRKDLYSKGITKREEFEELARKLGLVYDDDYPKFLLWWWGVLRKLKSWAFWKYALCALAALIIVFIFSVVANQKGNFLVTMSDALAENGLTLSSKEDLSEAKIRLSSDVLQEVNAFSIGALPDNLDEQEGSHNMADVIAYTFWATNDGKETYGYDWYLVLNNSTQSVEQAIWLMVYEDGEMIIYSKPSQSGDPEEVSGLIMAPLMDQAMYPDKQFRQEDDDTYTVTSVPYLENNIVAKGSFEDVEPGETHKFTVVIWIEGKDPDCTEDLIGGHAGFNMKFTPLGEDDDIYDKYGRAEEEADLHREGVGSIIDDLQEKVKVEETTEE